MRLPVFRGKRNAHVPRDRDKMDRRVGRAADRRASDDRVLECGASENVGRLQILVHDLDGAPAGFIGDLRPLAIGRGNGGTARQRHAERLGERIHGRCRAHGVAMADRWRRGGDDVDEFLVVDLAGGDVLARLPHDRAGANEPAVRAVAIEHRSAGEHDGRNVDGCRCHQARGRGLVAAGGQHHAVERIAVQHLDQAQIGEVAVERRGRTLAGLLDGMDRKLEGDAARLADAFADALGEFQVMPVAGAQIRAGLRDPDDRPARCQLLARQSIIEVALEIERGHARIVRIVEPQLRTQARLL